MSGIDMQVRLDLSGLQAVQRSFESFTRAYLYSLGTRVIQQNVNNVLTPATRGAATPRTLRASSLATRRGVSVPRTTPRGRPSRAVTGAAGVNYAWENLPLNQAETYRRKARNPASERGGLLLSLVDTGLLTNPNMYRLTLTDAETIILRVPADRERILTYLRADGYKYWGIPRTLDGLQPSVYAAGLFADAMERWERTGYAPVPLTFFVGL